MTGLYMLATVFGAVLIGVSMLFGGGDLEADVDVDVDVDADVDLDADGDAELGTDGTWMPFLSMRFWTFFAFVFGATGLLLTLLGVAAVLVGLIAVFNATAVGAGTAWFFRKLRADKVTADVGLARFIGTEARVLLPIRPGGRGKIVVDGLEGSVELVARSHDDKEIRPGDRVLIAHVDGDTADVTRLAGPPQGARQGQGVAS